MTALQLAWRNLVRNRERSLLTLIGVLLAIGSFVALVSLAEGLSRRVTQELDYRDVDLYLLPQKAMALPTGPIGTLGLSGDTISEQQLEAVRGSDFVAHAEGIVRDTWTGARTVLPVLYVNNTSLPMLFPNLQGIGEPLKEKELYLGQGLAQVEFDGTPPANLTHGQDNYAVKGVVSGNGFQNYTAFAALSADQSKGGYHEVWIQLKDKATAVGTMNELAALNIPNTILLSKQQYLARSHVYLDYARLLQVCIAAVGILISITASMNTMLMSTYERLREFAILRAVGASRLTVAVMVCAESILLSLFGGFLGICFGVLVSGVLDRAVVVLLKLPFPLAKITPWLLLEATAVSGLVGLIGAILPAVIVWRLNLMEGLRRD